MTSTKWKLATVLGVAGAIALAVPSAEARNGRNAAIGFGIAAGALALGAIAAAASQPRYYDGYYGPGYGGYYGGGPYAYYGGGPYAYSGAYGAYYDPYAYGAYYGGYGSYYGNRTNQIPGTNWNPNQ